MLPSKERPSGKARSHLQVKIIKQRKAFREILSQATEKLTLTGEDYEAEESLRENTVTHIGKDY